MKYIVSEVQHFPNGAVSVLSWAYDTEEDALAKYYTTLASAAKSSLTVHSAILYTEEGFTLKSDCFKHEATEEATESETEEEADG